MKDEKLMRVTPGDSPGAAETRPGDAGRAANVAQAGHAAPERPGTVDVHSYIGRQLRAIYDDVASQPVPDRFLALMKQLDAK